jgi:hypothetical protein
VSKEIELEKLSEVVDDMISTLQKSFGKLEQAGYEVDGLTLNQVLSTVYLEAVFMGIPEETSEAQFARKVLCDHMRDNLGDLLAQAEKEWIDEQVEA